MVEQLWRVQAVCVRLFVLFILGHSGPYMDLTPRIKRNLGVSRLAISPGM